MTPSIDREFSLEEARLADAGSRKLFSKPLSDIIDDFERVGQEIPVAFVDLLISVGKRVTLSPEASAVTVAPTQPAINEGRKSPSTNGGMRRLAGWMESVIVWLVAPAFILWLAELAADADLWFASSGFGVGASLVA